MSNYRASIKPVAFCAWTALAAFLATALLPVFFFRFPGPQIMPFRYEFMWAVTEILWKPLRMLQTGLTPLVGYDLRQLVNPYYAAPLVNGPMVFAAVASFLILRNAWQRRARTAEASPDLRAVTDRIEEIRMNYTTALREVTHPTVRADVSIQDARARVAKQRFFQPESKLEMQEKDDEGV